LGLGLTVRYGAVGVGVNSALRCCWGWGCLQGEEDVEHREGVFPSTQACGVDGHWRLTEAKGG